MAKKLAEEGKKKGGAWKLAYADFTTSMMCFFLVMWIINSRTKQDKAMMADYFNNQLNVVNLPKQSAKNQYSGSKAKTPYKDLESVMLQVSDSRIVSLMERIILNNSSISYDVMPGGIALQLINPNRYEPIFETGKSELTAYGKNLIFETLQKVKKYYKGLIAIVGHSDAKQFRNDSKRNKNIRLSIERAISVRKFMIENVKFDYKKIAYIAGAGSKNIGDYRDDSRHYLNRRVTFMLLDAEKMLKYFQHAKMDNVPPK